MGGFTYLFSFVFNAIIAAFLGGLAAIIAAAIPRKKVVGAPEEQGWSRPKRALATFAIVWLLVMLYGCIQMGRTHHYELDQAEGARKVPGLIESTEQVIQAVQIAHGDTAQTYVLIETTGDQVERIAGLKRLRAAEFDAHTARSRGWIIPEWWPTKACRGGVTYNDDPWAKPPSYSEYTLNWCPAERRAYIQNFDY